MVQETIMMPFAEITIYKDRVAHVLYKDEAALNVSKAIDTYDKIRLATDGMPFVIVHDFSNKYIFSTDALRFMESQMNFETHQLLGRAFVSTNPASRISANNFIRLFKPVMPVKLFSSPQDALKWAEDLLN